MEKIIETLKVVLLVPFFIIWSFGGLIGCVYWAVENSLLDVVLSLFIPGYGAISVFFDII